MKFQKILIGVDDSKFAENATQYGFELAHQFSAAVALVHIVEPIITTPANDTSMMGNFIPSISAEENIEVANVQQTYSQKLIDDTITRYGEGLTVTQYNEMGDTADVIVNCATQFGADLIVIGTHGRTGFDRLLMGSVAESVVRHSPVPVLVVPMKVEE
jgi:nucleotide-binding universal stress UspA family protein